MGVIFLVIVVAVGMCAGGGWAKTCDVVTYGAVGNGKTDNTQAIQKAINDCLTGGTVVIPAGEFLTYPLNVAGGSGFTIQLLGTLVAGTQNNWPMVNGEYTNFLTISKCDKCTINGNGMVNGQGTPWYIAFDKKNFNRPNLIAISHATDLVITGVTLLNSPCMFITLSETVGAELSYINITAEWYDNGTKEPHNTDGIDPGGNSKNIHIHHVYIYNGDDNVAVKPGTTAGGCTSDILVEHSVFYRGHGASIGSVGSGCIQNVLFYNISMHSQLGACILKTYNNGPGFVKNITWSAITIDNTDHCLYINTAYHQTPNKPELDISDINYINIQGQGCTTPADFDCQAAKPCTDINLRNVNVAANAKTKTMVCANAHGSASNVLPPSCLLP